MRQAGSRLTRRVRKQHSPEKWALSDTSTGLPWKVYSLTEKSRNFLEDHNLLAAEEMLQQIYKTISDKPRKWSVRNR